MHTPKDIAEAYFIESSVDIETARLTNINGLFSRTIQFSQEAIEKVTKACLAINDIYTRDHKTSTLFKAVFSKDVSNAKDIENAMISLEKHGARTRFPLYQRSDLPLWIPSKVYGEEEAKDALALAELVYNTLKEYLNKKIESDKEAK